MDCTMRDASLCGSLSYLLPNPFIMSSGGAYKSVEKVLEWRLLAC